MKALQYHSREQPLCLRSLPDLVPTEDQNVFEVVASALNHRDVWICKGLYPGIYPNVTLGSDGVVRLGGEDFLINPNIAWGADTNLPSDIYSILGMPTDGTFAEQIALHRNQLFRMPEHLDYFEGAALPLGRPHSLSSIVFTMSIEAIRSCLYHGNWWWGCIDCVAICFSSRSGGLGHLEQSDQDQ